MTNKVTEEFNLSTTGFKMTSSEFVPEFKPTAPEFIPATKPAMEVKKIPEFKPEPPKPVAPAPPKKTAQELKLESKLTSMGSDLVALFNRIKTEKLNESNLREFLKSVTPT